VRIAATRAELTAAFELVYRRYLARGYIPPNDGQIFYHPRLGQPSSRTIVAMDPSGQAVGTLTVTGDSGQWLGLEATFPCEVQQLRQQRRRLAESTLLAIQPSGNTQSAVFFALTKFMIHYVIWKGYDDLLLAIHPRHRRFYWRHFHAERMGGCRSHTAASGNPAVCCRIDVSNLSGWWAPELREQYFHDPPDVREFTAPPIQPEDHAYFCRRLGVEPGQQLPLPHWRPFSAPAGASASAMAAVAEGSGIPELQRPRYHPHSHHFGKDAQTALRERGRAMEGSNAPLPPAAEDYFAGQDYPAVFSPTTEFSWALSKWEKLLGTSHVLCDESTLESYSKTTLPQGTRPRAVLRPGNTSEVSQLVAVANEHSIPLYPVSGGKNWGYGDRCAVTDGQVIVDLSRMNRIVEVNRELAYAVVEPGVTQGQLYEHLRDNGIPLWIDPTGAGPTASLLGNAVERGYGITPYGDHFVQICGMEVVLANGEVLRTGFGHYPEARATRVFPRGVGPYLDGIFTQSNFGIVTRTGIWLMPVPEHYELCLFRTDREEAFDGLIERVRHLLLHGVVRSSINLMHRNRMLTVLRQYPWEEMGGGTPMSGEVARQLADSAKVGLWNGVAALYGSKKEVRAAKRAVRRSMKGLTDRLVFVSGGTLRLLERFPGILSAVTRLNIPELIRAIRPAFGVMSGEPSQVALKSAFWRARRPAPEGEIDPVGNRAGVIWFSPVIPMTVRDVRQFRQIVEPIMARHGFDCCITLTTVNPRCFDCTLPVFYDAEDAQEAQRAYACHRELFSACAAEGYLPYRVDIRSMPSLAQASSVFWDVCTRLKQTLDPHEILAPGRYQTRRPT